MEYYYKSALFVEDYCENVDIDLRELFERAYKDFFGVSEVEPIRNSLDTALHEFIQFRYVSGVVSKYLEKRVFLA